MNKKLLSQYLFLFLLFISFLQGFGQGTIEDRAIRVRATAQENPTQIVLTWEASSYAVSTQIYRKLKSEALFPVTPIATIAAPNNTYIDNNVFVGVQYDYTVLQQTTFTTSNNLFLYAWGGISAGIKLGIDPYKGKLLIVADTLIQNSLQVKFERFKNDLIEDGWMVTVVDKTTSDSVPSIKEKIRNWYNLDPLNAKSLILLGDIPVPYSGNFGITAQPIDGHSPDHNGAWAADVYYGIMDETLFTDFALNEAGITREANKNRPGDGKFDQNTIPGTVQLQIGRIDMSNLNLVGSTYLGRTEIYFDKNHAFRNKQFDVPRRYIFEDRLALLGSEAPGRLHYFQASLFHKDSMFKVSNDFFAQVKSKPTLWSGVTSTAGYTSINGVGGVANFADSVYSVFSNYFGSYFVDWDINNNFLRGAIAGPGYTLTSIWSGRPVVQFHQMGIGETIGFCLKQSQGNGIFQGSMGFYPGIGQRNIHMSMHGDPTLRLHTIHPISNLVSTKINNNTQVQLDWTASTEQGLDGYMVYRATNTDGPYRAISSNIVSNNSFIDLMPFKGDNYYMVRAIKLEASFSGSYYNLSQGRRTEALDVDGQEGAALFVEETEILNDILVYPNPSNGELNFSLNKFEHIVQGNISDVSGKELKTFQIDANHQSIDLSYLPTGVYFVKLQTVNGIRTVKWIKV